VAPNIAGHFALPLIAKDTVKDALMSVLAVPDVEASRRLGQAAIRTMLALAAASPIGAVLKSNFNRLRAVNELHALPGEVLEVFCRCDREVAARRYRTRAGTRHAGHFDQVRTAEELWNDKISERVAMLAGLSAAVLDGRGTAESHRNRTERGTREAVRAVPRRCRPQDDPHLVRSTD